MLVKEDKKLLSFKNAAKRASNPSKVMHFFGGSETGAYFWIAISVLYASSLSVLFVSFFFPLHCDIWCCSLIHALNAFRV